MSILATIEALHAELDANPDAHQTRLILADALEDAGGHWAEMAPGYRALGANRIVPVPTHDTPGRHPFRWANPGYTVTSYAALVRGERVEIVHSVLPDDWHALIPKWTESSLSRDWKCRDTRRRAEDAAALAFAKLPADRQRELLNHNPTEATK